MVEPLSNAPNVRELGASATRPQASPSIPGAVQASTNLAPDQRVEFLQEAVSKLIKKSLPSDSKLQITQDRETGTYIYRSVNPDTGEVIKQWPSEQLLELHAYLKEMEGLLVDKRV